MDFSDLVYIDDTGYHYPDYPTILAWLKGKYQAIYGPDVYLEADSQDGQWVADIAKALYDTATRGASTFNSFTPLGAQGVGLARLVKINGLRKKIASFSTVTVSVGGTVGTVITNGVAQDTLGQLWSLPATVTIPGGGTIDVVATAQQIGFVTAAMSTVTKIFTPTLGWQTVTNAAAATPGAPIETDAQLRIRQSQSTALPSQTVFDGMVGAVQNVAGVVKARGYENDTGSTDANGILAHTTSIVVDGGADLDIANAILEHKTPGSGTQGATTVLVHDAHGMPINIKFQRVVTATIQVTVTGTALTGWSTDFIPLIQQAVADFINAGNIGDTIIYTKLFPVSYLPGNPAGLTYDISAITAGKNGGGQSAANVTLTYDENPVCVAASDVTVTIT